MRTWTFLFGLIFVLPVSSGAQDGRERRARPTSRLLDYVERDATYTHDHPVTAKADLSSSAGTVSVHELQHKPPRKAEKEYRNGTKAYFHGDYELAQSRFQKAIFIDPDFAAAHSDLGVVNDILQQHQAALKEFQKAIELAPENSVALGNLAVLLCRMQQFADAERISQRGLRVWPGDLKCRFVLAVCQTHVNIDRLEALRNLERAAVKYPSARLVASRILAGMGLSDRAADELEQFLRSSPERSELRTVAERDLARLRE